MTREVPLAWATSAECPGLLRGLLAVTFARGLSIVQVAEGLGVRPVVVQRLMQPGRGWTLIGNVERVLSAFGAEAIVRAQEAHLSVPLLNPTQEQILNGQRQLKMSYLTAGRPFKSEPSIVSLVERAVDSLSRPLPAGEVTVPSLEEAAAYLLGCAGMRAHHATAVSGVLPPHITEYLDRALYLKEDAIADLRHRPTVEYVSITHLVICRDEMFTEWRTTGGAHLLRQEWSGSLNQRPVPGQWHEVDPAQEDRLVQKWHQCTAKPLKMMGERRGGLHLIGQLQNACGVSVTITAGDLRVHVVPHWAMEHLPEAAERTASVGPALSTFDHKAITDAVREGMSTLTVAQRFKVSRWWVSVLCRSSGVALPREAAINHLTEAADDVLSSMLGKT